MSDRIAELQSRSERQAEAAEARARQLAPLLPLAERLALYPAATLLSVPGRPEDSVRAVLVVQGLARTIARQVAALAAERASLSATMQELQAARAQQADAATRQRPNRRGRSTRRSRTRCGGGTRPATRQARARARPKRTRRARRA